MVSLCNDASLAVWGNELVLRVAIEGQGYAGFIEVNSSTTLENARNEITSEFDDPQGVGADNSINGAALSSGQFRFILSDGVPIARKQEARRLASDFLPCLFVRIVPQGVMGSNEFAQGSQQQQTNSNKQNSSPRNGSKTVAMSNTDAKVTVTYRGDILSVWVTPSYTFGQLRRDAARYWNLKPSDATLLDREGCAWPDDGPLNYAVRTGLVQRHGLALCAKGGNNTAAAANSSSGNKKKSPNKHNHNDDHSFRNTWNDDHNKTSSDQQREHMPASIQISNPAAATQPHSSEEPPVPTCLSILDPDKQEEILLSRYSQLWRIFTYYCVQGNSLSPTTLDSRRFVGLLRDSRVLSPRLTATDLNIIYTSTLRGSKSRKARTQVDSKYTRQTRSSKKTNSTMGFDLFLDALVDVSLRMFGSTTVSHAHDQMMNCLTQLLTTRILPFASSWSSLNWHRLNNVIYRSPVLSKLEPFAASLHQIFSFYAPSARSNQVDIEAEMCLDFDRFRAITVDFEFGLIGLSAINVAQVFLASAESRGVGTRIKTSSGKFLFGSLDEDGYEPATATTLHADGTAAWDRTVLFFPQFLDALLRIAWFCYASYKGNKQQNPVPNPWQTSYPGSSVGNGARLDHYGDQHVDEEQANSGLDSYCPPEDMVLALFQHLSKTLRQSNVTAIEEKRQTMKRTSRSLFEGTRGISDTFSHIWLSQGQPDFLTRAALGRDNNTFTHTLTNSTNTPTPHKLPMSPALRKAKAAHRIQLENASTARGRDVLTQLLQIESANQLGLSAHVMDSRVVGQAPPGSLWKPGAHMNNDFCLEEEGKLPSPENKNENGSLSNSRRSSLQEAGDTVMFRHQIVDRDEDMAYRRQLLYGILPPETNSAVSGTEENEIEDNDEAKTPGDEINITTSPAFVNYAKHVRGAAGRSNSQAGIHIRAQGRTDNRGQGRIDARNQGRTDARGQLDDTHENVQVRENQQNEFEMGENYEGNVNQTQKQNWEEGQQQHHSSYNLDECDTDDNPFSVGSEEEHEYVDLGQFRAMLTKGGTFHKHGRRGTPHQRFIWCDTELNRICWCPPSKQSAGPLRGRYLVVDSIDDVRKGRTTNVFQRRKVRNSMSFSSSNQHDSVDAADEKCFSLVSKDRTLDLEAESEEMRDSWVKAFDALVKWKQKKQKDDEPLATSSARGSGGSKSDSLSGFHTPATSALSTVEESKST